MKSLYDFDLRNIDGETVRLETFKGRVLLLVNVASKCGFTRQYAGLERLYETYRDAGLTVLGFPSNDFLRQEPGTEPEIKAFCSLTYGVTFPLFAKIKVRGRDQHPLYAFLTGKETNPQFHGKITWNFNKFLIARDGRVAGRFDSRMEPLDPALVQAVEKELTR